MCRKEMFAWYPTKENVNQQPTNKTKHKVGLQVQTCSQMKTTGV